jgi:Protein of unknown function (DUF3800)
LLADERDQFSDYIVFVDESGSPSLSSVDPQHPVFVLAFCVFNKWTYCDVIQPAIKRLKFEFFGHDMTVLHSHDIRKRNGDFEILLNAERRMRFLSRLDQIVGATPFDIIATVIDKREVTGGSGEHPDYLYHSALFECTKKLYYFLKERGAERDMTHIIAESRGRSEDRGLAEAFANIMRGMSIDDAGVNFYYHTDHLTLKFAEKKINSAGLQIADLVGHPIGRHAINPNQANHAFEIIKDKVFGDIWPFFLP